jgi:3-deoxy-D-arabino-heptulosonate 7-phosphate (DAHP) synthase
MSDGEQSLDFTMFEELARQVHPDGALRKRVQMA